ncbi:hypothetical protein ABZ400_28835 [Streptomyces sp. NPDC005897]
MNRSTASMTSAGGAFMGAWMQQRATLEQSAAQEWAEQRGQLRTDRRAS